MSALAITVKALQGRVAELGRLQEAGRRRVRLRPSPPRLSGNRKRPSRRS